MAPRRYDRRRRDEVMAATRERIVGAVVALHAELGPSRTTYAMIAGRADVAVPTVYKHFPKLAGLFAACIGHVSAQVPPLSPDALSRHPDAAARLTDLARVLFERHQLFAPWLRWSRHETHLLPDMAVYFTKMRERHVRLIREALEPAHGSQPPAKLVAVIEALTGFDAWQTLTRDNGLSASEAAEAVADTLRALVGRIPASRAATPQSRARPGARIARGGRRRPGPH